MSKIVQNCRNCQGAPEFSTRNLHTEFVSYIDVKDIIFISLINAYKKHPGNLEICDNFEILPHCENCSTPRYCFCKQQKMLLEPF